MENGHDAHDASADAENPVFPDLDMSRISLCQVARNSRNHFFMRQPDVTLRDGFQNLRIENVAHVVFTVTFVPLACRALFSRSVFVRRPRANLIRAISRPASRAWPTRKKCRTHGGNVLRT